jgi:glycosyltransferase involved in cell wall biosynthesis
MNSKSKKILVSVIIPVYNAEIFLNETLQSVLNQNLKNFEIILVNDGSTDNSKKICEKFSNQDNRIKLINQINSGVSIARNNGILHAKGEYVFFMDADDTLDAEFLKTSYEIAKKQDSDIVVIGEQFCKRMPNVTALPTWAQLIRMEFLKQYQSIRFPDNIQPCEDGLFSHQLLALTEKIAQNHEGIYHYRHHENQNHLKINENCEKVTKQIPTWFEILENFYTKHGLFKSHSLHLALFIEHEPFEFRYLAMPLNQGQKVFLHQIIKDFMSKNVFPHLDEESKKSLSIPFLKFVNSKKFDDFDRFYIKYLKQRKIKKKLCLFAINMIPLSEIRKNLRKNINDQFQ